MSIKPLRDMIAILPDVDNGISQTTSGLLIVQSKDTKHKSASVGTIVGAGPGTEIDGQFDSMVLKVGQRVLFNNNTGIHFEVDKVKHIFLKQRDIMGIIPA